MVFETKTPPTARFVVFRHVVNFVFFAPVIVVHLRSGIPATYVAMGICFSLYALWEHWFKRRLNKDQTEAYEAVFDENNATKVLRVRDYATLRLAIIWLLLAIVFLFV